MQNERMEPCPACEHAEARVLFHATDRLFRTTSKVFAVVECKGCGLTRLHPWPEPGELSEYYPPTYWFDPSGEQAAETYRRLVLRDHLRFVRQAAAGCGEEGPVVDVGCGGGLFLRMMAEEGQKVMGVDFSVDAASIAWRAQQVPVICADFARAPLPDASVAVVTMFHVLEHLYQPAEYLHAAHRVLRPNGRLVVQTPNASSWQFFLLGEHWSGLDVPRHLFDFRARDLEILLDCCGFEVIRRKDFSLRDNPAGLASSLFPWLDPMARRVRRVPESPKLRFFKDVLYLAVLLMCLPFTLLEAACGAGSTVMFEARKKA
jgi:SAM-dependent methyltransferase